jgi:hypothetical protein
MGHSPIECFEQKKKMTQTRATPQLPSPFGEVHGLVSVGHQYRQAAEKVLDLTHTPLNFKYVISGFENLCQRILGLGKKRIGVATIQHLTGQAHRLGLIDRRTIGR